MSPALLTSQLYRQTRRGALVICLGLLCVSGVFATVFHYFEPETRLVDLILPPLISISCLGLALYLCYHPERIEAVTQTLKFALWGCIVIPIDLFVLEASYFPDRTLVDILPPPLVSGILPLTSGLFLFIRHRNWRLSAIILWCFLSVPVLVYLFLNPTELYSTRGIDIAFSFGPNLIISLIFIVLLVYLQEAIEKLFADRISYYCDLVDRQALRQSSMEQAFTLIHNGPLQTLALLMREAKSSNISKTEIIDRIEALNTEIRAIGQTITDFNTSDEQILAIDPNFTTETLRLADGTDLDLDRPLHLLLREVYTRTLRRDLPHFQTVRIKVRDFHALSEFLSSDTKRELCLWLEEALCNAGKHAVGATRITATGRFQSKNYVLKVQDNGAGLKNNKPSTGTIKSESLAMRLGGTFQRESLSSGGVVCELSWPLSDR